MTPTLSALVALQVVDSAIDGARRRLAELPGIERGLDAQVAAASAAVDAAKAKLTESQTARRALEKDVAGVDARMARFDEHKAAVKTNQEYTALLHEIATAKTDKDAIEERILIAMEEADGLASAVKAAETTLAALKIDVAKQKTAIAAERAQFDAELTKRQQERTAQVSGIERGALNTYEQLLKGRRGVAVSQMLPDGHCAACHVRLRPHIEQKVKRGDEMISCDSCQRILYFAAETSAPQNA